MATPQRPQNAELSQWLEARQSLLKIVSKQPQLPTGKSWTGFPLKAKSQVERWRHPRRWSPFRLAPRIS